MDTMEERIQKLEKQLEEIKQKKEQKKQEKDLQYQQCQQYANASKITTKEWLIVSGFLLLFWVAWGFFLYKNPHITF